MFRALCVVFTPIILFAHIDQDGIPALAPLPRIGRRNLRDLLLCLRNQSLKTIRL